MRLSNKKYMDLKKFLPSQDKQDVVHYWAVVIEPGWVQVGIWKIEGTSAHIVSSGSPSPWDLNEDLLVTVDTALSEVIKKFPEELDEPSKTVFGVASSWVEEGQIKDKHLEIIKKVCKELSLSPVGFVVLPEAISHYYKSLEGGPLSAIVVGLYKEDIEVSLFNLGELVGSTKVARSISVVDDVVEGLVRFGQADNLPSRFILYNGREGELMEVEQSLLKVNWDDLENIKFVHTPKIETVDSTGKVHAVSLAGASELSEITSVVSVDLKKTEDNIVTEIEKEASIDNIDIVQPEAVGFVADKDIRKDVVGRETVTQDRKSHQSLEAGELDNIKTVETDEKRHKKLFPGRAKLLAVFSKIKFPRPKFSGGKLAVLKSATGGRRPFFFGIAFLILVLIGGFSFWWFVPKATVTIYVSPKKLDEKIEVRISDDENSLDIKEKILPGNIVKTSVKGEKTKSTTGTKTVGDKARGEVTIYRVGSELSLSAGVIITGPENLRFTLDEAVTVASGSAGSPGETKAFVASEDIGSQYNLASGSIFRVGNYSTSDMEAKNNESFSGGSSREINAVASEDMDGLKEDLEEELKEKAIKKLLDQISVSEEFIEESVKNKTTLEEYSDKEGDEASTLKLMLEVDVEAIVINRLEMVEISREILKEKIPEGFVLREEQIGAEFKYKDFDDGYYLFDMFINANLLPAVDPQDVSEKLVGKYRKLADEYLNRDIPGFVRAEIKIRPSLPGRLNTMPRMSKNINVEISAER